MLARTRVGAVGKLHPRDGRMIKAVPTTLNPASRRSRSACGLLTYGHAEWFVGGAGSVTGLTVTAPAMGG